MRRFLWLLLAGLITHPVNADCVVVAQQQPIIHLQVCGAGSRAHKSSLAEFSRHFLRHVDAAFLPIGNSFASPIHIELTADRDAFQASVRQLRRGRPPPEYAWYDPAARRIVAPADSNPGFIAHELMHPLVEHQLPARPRWASEGIPLFFEAFTARSQSDDWHWQFHGLNEYRAALLGDTLPRLNLRFTLQQHAMGYHNVQSELSMLVAYLWQRGAFKPLLRHLADGDRGVYDSYFEAALGQPLHAIEPDWRRWLRAVSKDLPAVSQSGPARLINADASSATLAK